MNDEIREALVYIDPATLDYQEWLNVGMAVKEAGGSCNLWDEWSRRDPARYDGGCWSKWGSFKSDGITKKTLFKMAIERGYRSPYSESKGRELMDGEILHVDDHYQVIDKDMIDSKNVPEPVNWDPLEDIRRYLSVLFGANDHVSYCVESYSDKDGKYHPKGRVYDRTAGRLLEELDSAHEIEDVFYDYNHDCGAWISFNPMDGNGGSIDNITDFKYTLVESDTQEIEVQYALMTKLELPIAALVHSGNKSIHAIVRIEAGNEKEYARRVHYLFKVCKKNGLDVDTSTKNPSRLSRMPGFMRGDKKQYLIATNIGKESWDEWVEYIESINDDLPDPQDFTDVWENLPELAPELIHGVLRKGHKMLLSGGSKTGKSMLMIQLAIAIASGGHWLNRYCEQGKVLYVNLEIDSASFARRIDAACKQRGITPAKISHNLRIWNLRGHSTRLDQLTPKLIRRCEKENYTAIIIDPIYKVMMGDENKAGDMAQFCNQFDAIATKLNCAVIYVHHFSKGEQGKKASIDRASGSGVFARDPDTIATVTKLYNVAGTFPAVRVEFTLREFPEFDPIDAWYRYPIHVVDTEGELKGATVEEKKRKTHEESLQDFVYSLEVAFENLCEDKEGNLREVPQPELIKYMDINRTQFLGWYKEAAENGMTNLIKKDNGRGKTVTFYRDNS